MSGTAQKSLRRRGVILVLAAPLVILATVACVLSVGDSQNGGGKLPVALGITSGTLHPVAGGFRPDDTEVGECTDDSSCLAQGFGNLAYRDGPRKALVHFEDMIVSDQAVRLNCHRIVHTIGSAALARAHGELGRAFAHGSSTCASGYYHGILERAFDGLTSESELATAAKSLCDSSGVRRYSFVDYQCRHGLGHGLMIQTGYDLPRSLSLCDALLTRWDRSACASGVFMENTDTRFGFRSAWLDDDDPAYPCNDVRNTYQPSCYVRAATRITQLNGGAFADAADTCGSFGSRWATFCYRGLGREAAGAARHGEPPARVLLRCHALGEGAAECLFGAARAIADLFGAQGPRHAGGLCRHAPAGTHPRCYAGVGVVVGLLQPTRERRHDGCRRITTTKTDLEWCFASATSAVDPDSWQRWS